MTEVSTRPQVGATKAQARPKQAPSTAPVAAQPSEATRASSTLIVLSLLPIGAKFNGNRVERAQEAGFKYLNGPIPNPIGCVCPDTGQEIARFVVDKSSEANGQLKEIQLHVDPGLCATHYQAGTYLMKALEKYAILIGAHICDGMGTILSDAARQVLAEHIDAVVLDRRQIERYARVVEMPDGELRQTTELSFVHTTLRKAGSKKEVHETTWFAAPALHYYEGRAAGMRAAVEMIQFHKNHAIERPNFHHILHGAIQSFAGESVFGTYEQASPANVASGFLDIIEELVAFASRHVRDVKWVEHRIQAAEQSHVRWAEQREKEKRELIERLRKGREAAKTKRLEQGHGDKAGHHD